MWPCMCVCYSFTSAFLCICACVFLYVYMYVIRACVFAWVCVCVCLCVCDVLQPVPEELQNGGGFGYVVAFRPKGAAGWRKAAVPSASENYRYIFKNESIPPFSPYEVKVGVYNNKGEGPFGSIKTIYSAEEEPRQPPSRIRAKSLSASEIEVSWKPPPRNTRGRIQGYELRYWEKKEKEEMASVLRTVGNRTEGNRTSAIIRGLTGSTTYYITVRAYNTAGTGPVSDPAVSVTKETPSKPATSQSHVECAELKGRLELGASQGARQ
ncbi:hypothetical protein AGOR_G00159150 [Albula goreensis]|uniref:Fibronectin type-III domain-containing protein n=1 Tax=Albula goreensis TaxID=1534307 RepID=A0A8T3D024_9TELE|nr:hypothetical protein AGOR_G00159150 [Albula goreensis]